MNGWSRKDDGRFIVPPKYERAVDAVLAVVLLVCFAYIAGIYVTQFVPLLRAGGTP